MKIGLLLILILFLSGCDEDKERTHCLGTDSLCKTEVACKTDSDCEKTEVCSDDLICIPDHCRDIDCGAGICKNIDIFSAKCICDEGMVNGASLKCVPNHCERQEDCRGIKEGDHILSVCGASNRCQARCNSEFDCAGNSEVCQDNGTCLE